MIVGALGGRGGGKCDVAELQLCDRRRCAAIMHKPASQGSGCATRGMSLDDFRPPIMIMHLEAYCPSIRRISFRSGQLHSQLATYDIPTCANRSRHRDNASPPPISHPPPTTSTSLTPTPQRPKNPTASHPIPLQVPGLLPQRWRTRPNTKCPLQTTRLDIKKTGHNRHLHRRRLRLPPSTMATHGRRDRIPR